MIAKIKIVLFSIILFSVSQSIQAQLFGLGHNDVRSVDFKKRVGNKLVKDSLYIHDSIYVFNVNNESINKTTGQLRAVAPDTTTGWTYTLQLFRLADITYQDTIINGSNNIFTNLPSGAYRVRMHKDTIDTFFRAWVFVNRMRFHLVKDENGFVKGFEHTCEYLDLRPIQKTDNSFADSLKYILSDFTYYHPTTAAPNTLKNSIRTVAKAADGNTSVSKNFKIRIYDPPAINTRYTVTAVDTFKNTVTDQITYKTITTKADFDISVDTASHLNAFNIDTTTAHYELAGQDAKGEAPLHAMFVNKSKNGFTFEWRLADTTFVGADSSKVFSTDSLERVFHLYRDPYKYKVTLISTSLAGCVDSTEAKTLEVESSEMGAGNGDGAFPTAFKPNSSEPKNRKFYFKDDDSKIQWKSIRRLHLQIFNRWGTKVYDYDDEMYKGWEGWNGKTRLGLDAEQGVYYYVFEAYGWGDFVSKSSGGNTTTDGTNTDNNTTGNGGSGSTKSKKILGKGYFFLYRD